LPALHQLRVRADCLDAGPGALVRGESAGDVDREYDSSSVRRAARGWRHLDRARLVHRDRGHRVCGCDDGQSEEDFVRRGAMLTIGQLAAYAGVTVAAVRHYHKVGLLPEPQRDRSGYRSYDADAVVRLNRIHVLASEGVPLSRVDRLLNAEPDEFASSVRDIDRRLREEARRIQDTRKRLAQPA